MFRLTYQNTWIPTEKGQALSHAMLYITIVSLLYFIVDYYVYWRFSKSHVTLAFEVLSNKYDASY